MTEAIKYVEVKPLWGDMAVWNAQQIVVEPPSPPAVVKWWLGNDIPEANCKAAYFPAKSGYLTLADTYTDLTGNGHTAYTGVAPGWDSPGSPWSLDGTSQFLKTGVSVPSNGTWSVLIWYSGVSAIGGLNHGLVGFNIDANSGVYVGFLSDTYWRFENGANTTTSHAQFNDYSESQFGILGNHLYHLSPAWNVVGNGGGTPQTKELFIGAVNDGSGNPKWYTYGWITYVTIYDIVLTQQQHIDVHNSFLAAWV